MELGGAINIQFGVGRGKDANFDTDEQTKNDDLTVIFYQKL